jgi:hypothetical protein
VQIITLATENITAPIHLGCLYTCRTKQCIKLRCTLFIRNQALGRGSTRRTRAALQPSSCTFGERGKLGKREQCSSRAPVSWGGWGREGETRRTRATLQPSSCLMGRGGGGIEHRTVVSCAVVLLRCNMTLKRLPHVHKLSRDDNQRYQC